MSSFSKSLRYRLLATVTIAVVFASVGLVSAGEVRAADGFDHARLARTSLEEFIRPGYVRFAATIAGLNAKVGSLCETPSPQNLTVVRHAFRAGVVAWGGVEFITFGPVREDNRLERILFWPDRKGIGARQVRRLLYNKTARALDPARLAKMSVAVQGLGALEIVLFGAGSQDLATPVKGIFRCGYARAIARNLASIAKAVVAGWAPSGSFANLWLAAGPKNPVYLSGRETTHELAKLLNQGFDTVVEGRLEPIAGVGSGRHVRRPILSRSGATLALIEANVAGLHTLMFDGGVIDAVMAQAASDQEVTSVMKSAGTELSMALTGLHPLAQASHPMAEADRRKLVPAVFALRNVRENALGALRSAAGLSLGFNASDGD